MSRLRWFREHPGWPVAAVGTAVAALVLLRCRRGLQPYGLEGAQYIEHAERLTALGAWGRSAAGPTGLIDELDGSFPPVLHLVTGLLGSVTGHGAEQVLWTGLLWLGLLAAALAWATWSLSRSRPAAAAAACSVLLLPAAHGFATRYYYDLPMTALLWLAVAAALATFDRRPLLGGLAVGGIWLLANLLKWSSIPFGGLLLLAACCTPIRETAGRCFRPLRRFGALALALAVSLSGSLAWASAAGADSSLGVMLDVMWKGLGEGSVSQGRPAALASELGSWLGDRGPLLGSAFVSEKLLFYPVQTLTVVLSPLYALPVLLAAGLGARSRPDALPLVLGSLGGIGLFLLLWIPVIDERFVLTPLPALLLLAALGWDSLSGRRRQVLAGLGVGLGLWVGAEFHLGLPPLPSTAWEHVPDGTWRAPPLRGWGVAMGDSVEQRGWSRHDTTPGHRRDLREELYAAVSACRPQLVAIPPAGAGQGPAGEVYWLDYESLLEARRQGREPWDFTGECAETQEADVAIVALPPEAACLPSGWVQLQRFELEGGGAVGLYRPASLGPCS